MIVCRHRSSNEAKDRQERPFALAYLPLMQPDGTAIRDGEHSLCVYKVCRRAPAHRYRIVSRE